MLMSNDKSQSLFWSYLGLLVLIGWLCGLSSSLNAARFTLQEVDFLGSEIDGVNDGTRFDHGTYLVAFNHLGDAVGYAEHDGAIRSFLRKNDGTVIELLGLGGNFTQVTDINDAGVSVGKASLATGELHACKWDAQGNVTDLVLIYPGDWDNFNSHAEGINNLGDVTGYYLQSDTNGIRFVGFYLAHDAIQIVSFSSDLATGGFKNWAINDFATRAGDKFNADGQVALFQEDQSEEDILENPEAIFASGFGRSLSNFSDVAGFCVIEESAVQQGATETSNRACVWIEQRFQDIALDSINTNSDDINSNSSGLVKFGEQYSRANGVNDLCQVVGAARYDTEASIYQVVPNFDNRPDLFTISYTENDDGEIVGSDDVNPDYNGSNLGDFYYNGRPDSNSSIDEDERQMDRAFLWEKDLDKGDYVLYDLNLPEYVAEPTWVLLSATSINNAGQIIGYGLKDKAVRGFILTPTSAPPPTIRLLKPSNDFLLGDSLQFFAAFNQGFSQYTISSDGSELSGTANQMIGNFFNGSIFNINYFKIGDQEITVQFKDGDGNVIETKNFVVTIRDLLYEEWSERKGAGAPGDDTDLDGKKDLIEYAFDLNPTASEAFIYPGIDIDTEGNLLFVYKRRKQAAELELFYEVQASNNLEANDWSLYTPTATAENPNPVTVDPGEEGTPLETVTIRPNASDFEAGPFFVKVKVSLAN